MRWNIIQWEPELAEERLLAPKLQHGQIEEKYSASVDYAIFKKNLIRNQPREYNAAQLHKNDDQDLSIRIKRDGGEGNYWKLAKFYKALDYHNVVA